MLKEKLKLYKQELFLSLGLMVAGYIINQKIKNDTALKDFQNQEAILNAGTDAVQNYVLKYFKDKEYFGTNPVPSAYYSNWKVLGKTLDIIRGAFGSPVVIIKGYEMPVSGLMTSAFNMCLAAQIFPKNEKYLDLMNVIDTLQMNGQIKAAKSVLLDSKQILISMV